MRDVARLRLDRAQRHHGPDGRLVRRPDAAQADAPLRRRESPSRLAQHGGPAGEAHRRLSEAGRQMDRSDWQFPRMSEPTTHQWIASDGIELAYHELGEGKPVVLLH